MVTVLDELRRVLYTQRLGMLNVLVNDAVRESDGSVLFPASMLKNLEDQAGIPFDRLSGAEKDDWAPVKLAEWPLLAIPCPSCHLVEVLTFGRLGIQCHHCGHRPWRFGVVQASGATALMDTSHQVPAYLIGRDLANYKIYKDGQEAPLQGASVADIELELTVACTRMEKDI